MIGEVVSIGGVCVHVGYPVVSALFTVVDLNNVCRTRLVFLVVFF